MQRARNLYESTGRVLERTADPHWLVGIRLHDLRHEATSRFFELGLPQLHHFNQSFLFRPRQPLQAESLRRALDGALAHHAGAQVA